MKKNIKIGVGLLAAIGVVGVATYFIRQAKLLKNICVQAGSVDWSASVVEVAQIYQSGEPITEIELPLDLVLTNDSNTDVTIQKVDLDLYAEQDKIGVIATDFEQILEKNSIGDLSVDFQFIDDVNLVGLGVAYGTGVLIGDPMDFTIKGKITAKASIFETIEIKYTSTFTLAEMLAGTTDNDESGGNC